MRAEFTEFSFGYALTDSLRRGTFGGFNAAPVFPTLQAEGTPGGGYDVELPFPGSPMMIQFKIPEVLTRHSQLRPDGFDLPYYRMHLRPYRHSEQHRLMLQHQDNGRLIFYASPRFHRSQDLNTHFLASAVHRNTLFVAPNDIGDLPDNDDHHVAYRREPHPIQMRSAPRWISGRFDETYFESELSKIVPTRVSKQRSIAEFEGLLESLIGMTQEGRLGKSAGDEVYALRQRSTLAAAAYLAQVFFDSELFVVRRG